MTIDFWNFTRISSEIYFYLLYRTQQDKQTFFKIFDRTTLSESDNCEIIRYLVAILYFVDTYFHTSSFRLRATSTQRNFHFTVVWLWERRSIKKF